MAEEREITVRRAPPAPRNVRVVKTEPLSVDTLNVWLACDPLSKPEADAMGGAACYRYAIVVDGLAMGYASANNAEAGGAFIRGLRAGKTYKLGLQRVPADPLPAGCVRFSPSPVSEISYTTPAAGEVELARLKERWAYGGTLLPTVPVTCTEDNRQALIDTLNLQVDEFQDLVDFYKAHCDRLYDINTIIAGIISWYEALPDNLCFDENACIPIYSDAEDALDILRKIEYTAGKSCTDIDRAVAQLGVIRNCSKRYADLLQPTIPGDLMKLFDKWNYGGLLLVRIPVACTDANRKLLTNALTRVYNEYPELVNYYLGNCKWLDGINSILKVITNWYLDLTNNACFPPEEKYSPIDEDAQTALAGLQGIYSEGKSCTDEKRAVRLMEDLRNCATRYANLLKPTTLTVNITATGYDISDHTHNIPGRKDSATFTCDSITPTADGGYECTLYIGLESPGGGVPFSGRTSCDDFKLVFFKYEPGDWAVDETKSSPCADLFRYTGTATSITLTMIPPLSAIDAVKKYIEEKWGIAVVPSEPEDGWDNTVMEWCYTKKIPEVCGHEDEVIAWLVNNVGWHPPGYVPPHIDLGTSGIPPVIYLNEAAEFRIAIANPTKREIEVSASIVLTGVDVAREYTFDAANTTMIPTNTSGASSVPVTLPNDAIPAGRDTATYTVTARLNAYGLTF